MPFDQLTACFVAIAVLFNLLAERRPTDQPEWFPANLRRRVRLARWLETPTWTRWIPCGALFLLALWTLLRSPGLRFEAPSVAALAFVVWAVLSVIWSESRALTAPRSIQLAIVVASAFAIASHLSLAQCAFLVVVGNALFLLIGLVEDLATGCFRPGGVRFSGTLHATKQATHAVFAGLSAVYLLLVDYWDPPLALTVLAVAATLLCCTGTRSAFWPAVVAGVVWLARDGGVRGEVAWWSLAVLGVAVCVVGLAIPRWRGRLLRLALLGRGLDTWRTASNRTSVWRTVLESARRRPLLGFGHGAFWNARRSESQRNPRDPARRIYTSHSVYLEALINTGLIGLTLFCTVLVLAGVSALAAPPADSGYLLAVLTFVALNGALESTILIPTIRTFSFFLLLFALG